MEIDASFTELKLTPSFTAELGEDILAAHGIGQRPIILDAEELSKEELKQIFPQLDQALTALKFGMPFPYPVYLLSKIALPHPPLTVISSREELPTFYPAQHFTTTGRDMALLARSRILQERLRQAEGTLWQALQKQKEQDELQLEIELNTFYDQLGECLTH